MLENDAPKDMKAIERNLLSTSEVRSMNGSFSAMHGANGSLCHPTANRRNDMRWNCVHGVAWAVVWNTQHQ